MLRKLVANDFFSLDPNNAQPYVQLSILDAFVEIRDHTTWIQGLVMKKGLTKVRKLLIKGIKLV